MLRLRSRASRGLVAMTAAAAICLGVTAVGSSDAGAQGLVITHDHRRPHPHIRIRPPHGPIQLRNTAIRGDVRERVASITIDQCFYNPNGRQLEGQYLLPLPPGASIGKFTLTTGGQTMSGEVLPRDKARSIYENIVRQQKDPALLEYLDWGLFRARVFPIPARGEVRLSLRFEVILESEGGLSQLRLPLMRAGSPSSGKLSIDIRLDMATAIKTVYSPTHSVDIRGHDSHRRTVTYEDQGNRPRKDFVLYFARDDRDFGVHVLTHTKPGEPGFFMAMISPRVDLDRKRVEPKDVVLVLDTSGSMKGEKMKQAKGAARFCLQGLDPRDRFNLICFSTDARPFRESLVAATPENVKNALAFLDGQEALGGTNIYQALLRATGSLDDGERIGMTIFLTDGLPTIDVVDKKQILAAVKKSNRSRNRIFAFGVGSDVNTHLIDKLAEQNRGTRTYVSPGESIEVKVSAFYEKIRHPVLSDLSLAFDGIGAFDIYPRKLPDLFKGSQLLVLGRFTGTGSNAIRLSGKLGSERKTFVYETRYRSDTDHDFLARLWATRKVGYLLDQVRLSGAQKELTDSIVALGKRYGIVTPYTSFLVVEDHVHPLATGATRRDRGMWLGRAFRQAEERGRRGGDADLAKETGKVATLVSRASKKLKEADAPAASPSSGVFAGLLRDREGKRGKNPSAKPDDANARSGGFRVVGGHTFLRVDSAWVDTLYDAKTMGPALTRVEAYSTAYFDLLKKTPALAKLFAVGGECIVCHGGRAYHVVSKRAERK